VRGYKNGEGGVAGGCEERDGERGISKNSGLRQVHLEPLTPSRKPPVHNVTG